MLTFLKDIDRVGKNFNFNIDGKDTFRTGLGGVISILYYIALIAMFGYFGKDLFIRQDPNFIQRIDYLENYPILTLNKIFILPIFSLILKLDI